mmetsp:Transcript_41738/g.56903  ORF Transcript_41738/g.56903 Transcript_41738/m.56903 type:complete len:135 (-) Transcript_41738:120-524(-)
MCQASHRSLGPSASLPRWEAHSRILIGAARWTGTYTLDTKGSYIIATRVIKTNSLLRQAPGEMFDIIQRTRAKATLRGPPSTVFRRDTGKQTCKRKHANKMPNMASSSSKPELIIIAAVTAIGAHHMNRVRIRH